MTQANQSVLCAVHPSAHAIQVGFVKRHASAVIARTALWCGRAVSVEKKTNLVSVLEPFGMGDAISLEPLVTALTQSGEHVLLVLRKAWHPLFAEAPGVSLLDAKPPWIAYDSAGKYSIARYLGSDFRNWFSSLRSTIRGSRAIEPRGDARSQALLRLSGVGRLVTLDRYLGSDAIHLMPGPDVLVHDVGLRRWESNLRFAEAFGVDISPWRRPPDLRRLIPERDHGAGAPAGVAFAPLAPWPGKNWLPDRWRALARMCRDSGLPVTVLGGPGESRVLEEMFGSECPVVECSRLSDWFTQLPKFQRLVCVDSGPMHLAEALRVPVTALIGSSVLPLWAPSLPESRIVSHQSEMPTLPVLQIDRNLALCGESMKLIGVDDVFSEVNSI